MAKQAYEEVRKAGHSVIFLCANDIVKILNEKGINIIPALKEYLTENYKNSTS